PGLRRVLGGISPIDPDFVRNMQQRCVLGHVDVVAVHGFPLDWNHWTIHEWPDKLREIQAVTDLPLWVSEVGVSTFGAEEVRDLGVRHLRTGLSWADSFRPNAEAWFDRQMKALEPFDTTITYCFTPEHCGVAANHTSPPKDIAEFAEFCARMTRRYA